MNKIISNLRVDILIFMVGLSGCAIRPATPAVTSSSRLLDVDYDSVWNAAIKVVSSLPVRIAIAEKDSGLITTDWLQGGDFNCWGIVKTQWVTRVRFTIRVQRQGDAKTLLDGNYVQDYFMSHMNAWQTMSCANSEAERVFNQLMDKVAFESTVNYASTPPAKAEQPAESVPAKKAKK